MRPTAVLLYSLASDWTEAPDWAKYETGAQNRPLRVWIAFVPICVGVIAYVAGVFMIEDILAFCSMMSCSKAASVAFVARI